MSFKLKIFLFLFLIVSTTMLLSYLYGIQVVESDRRNYINEYLEHKAVNVNQSISNVINNLLILSDTLCMISVKDSYNANQYEEFLKKYLSLNKSVKGLYFKKKNLIFKFNADGMSAKINGNKDFSIDGEYVVINKEIGDCSFWVKFYLLDLMDIKNTLGDIIVSLGDIIYVDNKDISISIARELIKKTDGFVSKSQSGAFVHNNYVVGFSFSSANNLYVLFVVPRYLFEKAIISLRYNILVVGFLTLIIFLIVGFFVAGRITKPMTLLKEKARLIKGGVFEKVDINPPSDEIGEAVEAFNRMVEDLREKEMNLKESQMRLVQAEKMSAFGQLSAGIAHEVKNPLTAVLGYIQLLRRLEKDEKLNEYLRIVERETLRCKQILEDLLKFARMDRHQKSEVNIIEVLNNTIRLVSHQMMMKKIKLVSEQSEEKVMIVGNANQIQQVLLNILLNAMQSIERKGSVDGVVTVSVGREDRFVFISIKDTGEGIPPENLQKIFEPFFTTKSDMGGTGLGLSISYGIIKEHNGDIKVSSVVGEGTEFKIYLPTTAALC